MEVNERIFVLLEQQDKKAASLAEYIGVSAASVSAWKNENSFPSSKYIQKISEFLNVSISYLFTGIEENGHPVSEDEQELLSVYNKLDNRGKTMVKSKAYEELDRVEAKSRNEEYSAELAPERLA